MGLNTMDAKTIGTNSVKRSVQVMLKDLEALPEQAFTQNFGGKSRTVADIVYEVIKVNDDIGANMRGEQTPPWPDDGWLKAPADFQTKEAVISAFNASSSKLIETVEGFTEEQFAEKITTEHGETDRFERCRFIALHIWYHSGQLNFIQTMIGDDDWHWG